MDEDILTRIGNLTDEERLLEESHADEGLSPDDHERLKSIEVTLDRLWDLLRQRRALRDAGRPADGAEVRLEGTVEGYLQ